MPFTSELPVWAKVGTKPPATMLNTNGWVPGDKPPADWLNWFFNLSYEAIKELQLEALNVDQKGAVNGIASLGADGKVPSTQINLDVSGLVTDEELITVDERITAHISKDGTLLQKGHVQLFSGVTSSSEGLAATPKAVKTAMDRADAAFLQANDQKTKWASVIGSPLSSTDTSSVLQSKTQTIKNTLASNLSAKGQSAIGTETLTSLVNKVPLINTGKNYRTGTVTSNASGTIIITGVPFKPKMVRWYVNSTRFGYAYDGDSPALTNSGGTSASTTATITNDGFSVSAGAINTSGIVWEVWGE